MIKVKPGFFIRTPTRHSSKAKALPVLAYNDPSRRAEARYKSLGATTIKKLRMAGFQTNTQEHLGIDPLDVAVLLAMAQEQHSRLSKTFKPPQSYNVSLFVEIECLLYTKERIDVFDCCG